MMKACIFFITVGSGILFALASPTPIVDNGKTDDTLDHVIQIGSAIERAQSNKLSSQEQAMLEQLVDEAIAHEEYLRSRRKSDTKQVASNRLSSSYDHDEHHAVEYGPPKPPSYGSKSFSLWAFKKAIFSALLQGIKAITGGVLAVKGQLIKVKGHIVAAKGKLMETKGDALTEFGKHIATKALLTPVHSSSSYDHSPPAVEYHYGPYAHSGSSSHDTASVSLTYSSPSDYNKAPSAPPSSHSSYNEPLDDYSPPNMDSWSNHAPPQTDYADLSASPPHPPTNYGPPPSFGHYPPAAPPSYGAPPPHMTYSGPPATNYGVPVPSHSYGGPPHSSYDSYNSGGYHGGPSGGGGGGGYDSWGGSQNFKRDASEKKADTIHAGLIILKPAKSASSRESSESDSVYKKPQPFSKKSDTKTDETSQTER